MPTGGEKRGEWRERSDAALGYHWPSADSSKPRAPASRRAVDPEPKLGNSRTPSSWSAKLLRQNCPLPGLIPLQSFSSASPEEIFEVISPRSLFPMIHSQSTFLSELFFLSIIHAFSKYLIEEVMFNVWRGCHSVNSTRVFIVSPSYTVTSLGFNTMLGSREVFNRMHGVNEGRNEMGRIWKGLFGYLDSITSGWRIWKIHL